MPRQRRPDKAQPVEQPSTLSRIVTAVSDWRVIVGAIVGVFVFGGTVYAFVGSFATKAELGAAKTVIQKHNEEISAIRQALSDIAGNQKQTMVWIRDIYDHPRK